MNTPKNEEVALKLIKGIKLTKEEIVYLQKYHQQVGNGKSFTEKEVLATDYYKLPRGYRSMQTDMARRGYPVTGKGPNYNTNVG